MSASADAPAYSPGAPGAPEAAPALAGRAWPVWTPQAVAFCASAGLMAMEITAGRLTARHLGNSLYTWTSIIGVILAGLSAGNYLGGRLADRWRPEALLGWQFLASSLACLAALPLCQTFAYNERLRALAWPLRTLSLVAVSFLGPALALGTISPVGAKWAVARAHAAGRALGSVSAWGTLGSILGTFAAGFWLISALSAKGVAVGLALALGFAGLALGPARWLHALWAIFLLGVLIVARIPAPGPAPNGVTESRPDWSAWAQKTGQAWGLRESGERIFTADSDYQFIKVYDDESDNLPGKTLRVLSLDYLIHGYVDLEDPQWLEYDYERVYREVAKRFVAGKPKLSAFFLGGGSYTFPRWVMQNWPDSNVLVAEIDPLVLEANHLALGLPRDTPIVTRIGDARRVVDELAASERYDLIFGDAFNDLSVPWHLTTLEFNRKLAAHLAPDGAFLVNIIDDWTYAKLLGAYVATLERVFKHVYVFTTEVKGVKNRRETFVVAASNVELDFTDWQPNHGTTFEGSVLTETFLQELREKSGGRILTDDDAPVENLLEPVVRKR